MKTCLICKSEKELTEFSMNKTGKHYPYCKKCVCQKQKQKREERKLTFNENDVPFEKLCLKCNIIKPASAFNRDFLKGDFLSTYCKECRKRFPSQSLEKQNQRKREWRNKNRDYVREQNRLEKRRDYQKYREKRIKDSKEYYLKNKEKVLDSHKKYYQTNKSVVREKAKLYRNQNAELIKQKKALYYQNNKKYYTAKNSEWKKNNPEKRRQIEKRYFEKDPIRRIIRNMRNRIFIVLKRTNTTKADRTIEMLGCSPAFLKEHLESQFYSYTDSAGQTIKMTWENFGHGSGTWQVDHIVALCLFNLNNPNEQLIANHWTNLQPLWHHDHIIKSQLDLELKNEMVMD